MSGYCSPEELRTAINKTGTTGSASDESLQIVIDAVSQAIDRFFNRPDGFIADPLATARTYSGSGLRHQYIDDCAEVTLVEVKDSPDDASYVAWAATDWIAFSGSADNPNYNQLPYTGLMVAPDGDYDFFTKGGGWPTVRVTARWGYGLEAPPLIKEVTIALSARMFKQGESAWTDTLASAEAGGLLYRAQNADLRMLLERSRLFKAALG